MIIKELTSQNMTTCVYVVEGDEFGGYRSCGTIFAWHSKDPVVVGDDVVIEGPFPSPVSGGKVLSVFKLLTEDTVNMLKAFSSMDEAREAGIEYIA